MNQTLLEALVAWLAGNPDIAGLFTGGIFNTTAYPGAMLPSLNLVQSDSSPTGIIGRSSWIDKVTVSFEARFLTGDAAEIAVDGLRKTLFQNTSQLTWETGQECGRFLMPGAAGELEDGLGPDGSDVWVQRLPIGFTITRNA